MTTLVVYLCSILAPPLASPRCEPILLPQPTAEMCEARAYYYNHVLDVKRPYLGQVVANEVAMTRPAACE